MKIETWIFGSGALFYPPIAVIYGYITGWNEPLGVVALVLTGGMALLVALYFWVTSRRIDPRPEDDPFGEIAQGAGEQGVFAPYSWWPLWAGLAAAIIFAGMAAGVWLMLIGLGVGGVAVIGWVFEFYRGEHAH